MDSIFKKLILNNINKVENEFITLSKSVFLNEDGKYCHNGEFGIYRENIIKNLIDPFLPKRLSIGTGFIITSNGKRSTQCDIIIYDKNNAPNLESCEQKFFPIETVAAVIEVKSNLSKYQLRECLKKLSDIKKLKENINHSNYIFKDHLNSKFDNINCIYDQMATFVICESITDEIKEQESFFKETYKNIKTEFFHNGILSFKSACYSYYDHYKLKKIVNYPYFTNNNPLKNISIEPHFKNDKEHIISFLIGVYNTVSSVSIMHFEITDYLKTMNSTKIKIIS